MVERKNGPKLPKQQLAILAVARFAEPLALTSVFPYLPEMIKSFGVDKNEVARWAGFTGSVFSLSQSFTAVLWGRASDKFGRKPIILTGLLSTMFCFLLWGMSTSLPMALTARAIMGGGNGNVGIIRTMVAELVPQKELQPVAFSLMPLTWSIGSVFGPIFGGFFARPVDQYPSLFGNSVFFKKYPFALPNFVACGFFFISFMTGLLFLKETLESKRDKPDWGLQLGEKLASKLRRRPSPRRRKTRRLSYVDDEASAPLLAARTARIAADAKQPSMAEVFTDQTIINLVSYTFLTLHSVTYDQVLPVFLNYPRQIPDETNTHLPFKFSGGFGIGSDRIGSLYTLYGFCCGVVQFLLFPFLCRRYGAVVCYRASAMVFPIIYILTPYTALVQDDTARYVCLITLMLVKGFVVIIGFPCTTIMLTNSASSLRILGTLNGFATTFAAVGRAIGPAIAGAIFTRGVDRGYMIAPWWSMALVATIGAVPSWFIVEGDGPSGGSNANYEDDDEEDDEDEDGTLVPNSDDDESDAATAAAPGGYGTIARRRRGEDRAGAAVDPRDVKHGTPNIPAIKLDSPRPSSAAS
ncbi:major facilitator superfamily domain-containing protein [Lasiosphaeria ovina]|uniref:Major facilitator superfamily domain-containing protein n=1 Tax=Lasiosphaeria ovina TaxID=92902 RepID=A0AAE0NLD0_9PEZI|nr:major facilitator superfamily domain-containing protein [Lasiosphaeria ovina]